VRERDPIEAIDAGQLERVLVAQHDRLVGVLKRRTGSAADAEEILQAAYARALERGPPEADDEGLVRWFHRVLRNAWIDHGRSRDAERRALEREAAEREGEAAEPEELRAAVCACLHDVLPALKPEYADLVRQVDLEERQVSDVARSTGITANNASVRLHRARRALKDHLARACGACAAHGCLDCTCRGAPRTTKP
jgi:RNA polymerase sigma factor (sigma-70 family)